MGKYYGRYLTAVSLATALAFAALAGCASHTRPVVEAAQLTPEEQAFETVWQASRDVLREYRFSIDRQDRRAMVITTQPMLAQHWFECWRRDAVTPEALAEGTLQTIYRTARVQILPIARGYGVSVEVLVTPSPHQYQPIHSTSRAYALFRLSGEDDADREHFLITGGEEILPPTAMPEGDPQEARRDPALESRLAADIAARLTAAGH